MHRIAVAVLCLCFSFLTGHAATPEMSHQETVTRSAYARMKYAAEQEPVCVVANDGVLPVKYRKLPQDAKSIDAMLAAAKVTITLKDFAIGNVGDILDKKISAVLDSPPDGDILRSNPREWTFTEYGSKPQPCNGLTLKWERNPFPPGDESANLKFDDVYRLLWGIERPKTAWQTYALYSVAITYQNKTRSYRAMFVFGHDENGNEVVEPCDPITDNAALAEALHEPLFPSALVSTRLRLNPVAANWIAANQVADFENIRLAAGGLHQSIAACAAGDVCCDLQTLKCGPIRSDVSAALAQKIDGEK
jgi:hypothetical protein